MLGRIAVARLEPGSLFDAIAAELKGWEPRVELTLGMAESRIYEPDGTLYALVLSESSTLATDRRRVRVARGDLIIVPQAVALEADPEVDLLRIYHDGTPPFHFRERFIQIWGFEHIPYGATSEAPDAKYRVTYAIPDASNLLLDATDDGRTLRYIVALDGQARIIPDGGPALTFGPGELVRIGPGVRYTLEGSARFARLAIRSEWDHVARIAAKGAASPEFRPAGGGGGGQGGAAC